MGERRRLGALEVRSLPKGAYCNGELVGELCPLVRELFGAV